jgi:hypothetical protein
MDFLPRAPSGAIACAIGCLLIDRSGMACYDDNIFKTE